MLKFFKQGNKKILAYTIQLLYSKFLEMNYQMIKGGHPEPLLKFIIDQDLIAAADLIHHFKQMTLTDIKIVLAGCRIMCMMNREDQLNKNGSEIQARLVAISKWIEQKRLEIPKSELVLEEILKIVISELEKLLPKVIYKSSPIRA
jgi:hypothetical protein